MAKILKEPRKTRKEAKPKFTKKTRLMDMVSKEYHGELKVMIDELRRMTTLEDSEEWWQVKKLIFIHPKSMANYEPIADFIIKTTRNGSDGLKCSQRTFFRYITSNEHSNLNVKWDSAKSLVYNMISFKINNKNGIF